MMHLCLYPDLWVQVSHAHTHLPFTLRQRSSKLTLSSLGEPEARVLPLGSHAPYVVFIGGFPRVFPISVNSLSSNSEIIFGFSFSVTSHFQSTHHRSCQLFSQSIFQIHPQLPVWPSTTLISLCGLLAVIPPSSTREPEWLFRNRKHVMTSLASD